MSRLLNKGLFAARFKSNPEERRFAEAWDVINAMSHEPGTHTLDHLLVSDGAHSRVPTIKERVLAATVIQWLGSPCGQSFLTDLGYIRGQQAQSDALVFEMSEEEALQQGLLICKCGHPKNNHFGWGSCAHCKCTKYRPVAKVGTLR
jgi:hypothetical protein